MRGMLLLGLLLVPGLALADAGNLTRLEQMRRIWKDKEGRSVLSRMVHAARDRASAIWHMRSRKPVSLGASHPSRSPQVQRQRNEIAKALWSVRHAKSSVDEYAKSLLRQKLANWRAGKCSLSDVHATAMLVLAERRREEDRKRERAERSRGKRTLQVKLSSIRRVEGPRLQVFTELPPGRINQLRHLWKQMLVRPAKPIAMRF